jgi:DNA-directed RNA polymerase specialized sigma24 family protein
MRSGRAAAFAATSTPGRDVHFDAVANFRRETVDHRTPESLLSAAEEEAAAELSNRQLTSALERLPTQDALAIMLSEGLFGHRRHTPRELCRYLGTTEAEAAEIVASARKRLAELQDHRGHAAEESHAP